MFSGSTKYPSTCVTMALSFSRLAEVCLRGLAQVAFADKALSGVFVIIAIAAVSPWGALGAAMGGLFGPVAARLHMALTEDEWDAGLAGPNPAIAGIIWGSSFAAGEAGFGLLAVLLIVCHGIERIFRPLSLFLRLPVLSAPAIVTAYLVDGALYLNGDTLWHLPPGIPAGDYGFFIAIAVAAMALASKSGVAMLQVCVLSLAAALISGWQYQNGGFGPPGLWAFTIAPAAFAVHGVFLAGSRLGGWAGLAAAILGAAIWGVWVSSPLMAIVPPLLAPFILAVWLTLAWVKRLNPSLVTEPGLWKAAEEIRRALGQGKSVVALTGAGISTASGIPDYVSGSWLKPGIPTSTYSFERFQTSRHCRREYWAACNEFRLAAESAHPNPAHDALAAMDRANWLGTTITQNVDRLHQGAGARSVIELHGRIDRVTCLGCGKQHDWPPDGAWLSDDLTCDTCSGTLKPAVIALGEQIPVLDWKQAEEAAEKCGVMIIVGSRVAISSAVALLGKARQGGAKVVIVSLGPLAQALEPDDIVITEKAENILPALAILLDCFRS